MWEETDQCQSNRLKQEWTQEKRAHAYEFLRGHGVSAEVHHQGIEVGGRYVFSPKTFKWRYVGKSKWYRSAGIEDFFTRFYCWG